MKKQILFVDDEPLILQGLKRMLRGLRSEWDMTFVQSGAEALEKMVGAPFDVIVSDMRMPEMDGSQLLDTVKHRYPNMVRVVLSGHSEEEMIMKTVKSAHQFISKPCNAETLKSTISRMFALREVLTQEGLKRLVSRIESLPSLPSLYTQVVELIQSPNSSIKKIGEVISKDLAMTAKILQLVNSAFFGIPRQISNPAQAVGLLGLDTVKALVLTIGIFSKFEQKQLAHFGIETLWNHSIKTGAIAKKVADKESADKHLSDNAFMAGLLHDVGKLVLVANVPDKYEEVIETIKDQNITLNQAEQLVFGATHADVGAYLTGLWGLPDAIVEAVAFHHRPEICLSNDMIPLTFVHIADGLEHHGNGTLSMEAPILKIDYGYLQKLGWVEKIPEWLKTCAENKEEGKNDG
ncbi:MAG: HDOD domain-containing protein [Deltaproteobacteria bacterium]|nr:HDOD domain-containing protein [Deltaproteobacteria bacterium]MBW2014130.1 HDOD domain-containing protein [Deltaproteobacteria bacterium]MBW2089550.1 HDOD domain-containing protein [Deltaproteobacteria bacterium]MBW2320410.1 HDOD domain-containing protein [Deltaproteobacteria bacterium]